MELRAKSLIRVGLVTGTLLLIPLVAMQFSGEVNWTLFDFVVAGGLLAGTGLIYELAVGRVAATAYRLAVAAALLTALLLVWVNLAVGLIGSEKDPVNGLYLGVLAVAFIGSIAARLEPRGVARALFGAAIAQAMVPVVGLAIGSVPATVDLLEVLGVTVFFVALWLGSALLFLRAGASRTESTVATA